MRESESEAIDASERRESSVRCEGGSWLGFLSGFQVEFFKEKRVALGEESREKVSTRYLNILWNYYIYMDLHLQNFWELKFSSAGQNILGKEGLYTGQSMYNKSMWRNEAPLVTLQATNVSHLGKRKIISKGSKVPDLGWDMLAPRGVYTNQHFLHF